MTQATSFNDHNFINGGGESGNLIRAMKWTETTLGAASSWPQSLKSALSICLNSNFPIAIYWGPQLVLLYNDAWSPIPGTKHPWAMGKTAIEVWPEIWEDIQPQFAKAFTGIAGGSKDALLPMQRHGYTEECYFDFTFTPIYGESGNVEGIFNAVIETTYRVINERRSVLLQRLADGINSITSDEEVFGLASSIMRSAKEDVPFFYIYEFTRTEPFVLRGSSEDKKNLKDMWPVTEVSDGQVRHIQGVDRFFSSTPKGFWPELPSEALMLPLTRNDGQVFGCLIGGISARRKYDKEYKSFYESVARIIGGELNTIRSLKEERERAEAFAQIDRAKTAFFSNISHEFRTPLTLMLSPLEAVIDSNENSEEQKENLSTSYRNTLRLQKLVNALLDFSRIEAGRMDAKFEDVRLDKLTEDLASAFRSAIENAGLDFIVKLDPVTDPVHVDPDMWEKIILNLLSNAFKYTEKGSIELTLRNLKSEFVMSVRDTGIGIEEEHQPKVFERFYRVESSGGRSQEGTGIGLAMVKELVQLHGGKISVESEYGKGSVFTVSIPKTSGYGEPSGSLVNERQSTRTRAAFVEEAEKWNGRLLGSPTQQPTSSRPQRTAKVLVADDNRDMRHYITRLLQDDFEVRASTNGEEAYDAAVQWEPDLVICDIMMPKLDGFGLLRKMKSNLALQNVPVIFVSARAGEEARIEGIQAGADDYLVKPFSAKELVARVTNRVAINRTRNQTEKEFFNLFLQSPAHIHVFRGPEHVVEFFHPLGIKFIGRDITGLKIREALPEVEGQGYFEMLDQVYKEGKTVSLSAAKASLTDQDGNPEEYYFNITYLPWRGLDGAIQGVLQFTFDVTEQAKSFQKVQESEERFRLLANSISQFVWIADKKGAIEYISDRWEHYTGTSTDEGRKLFSSLIHQDDVGEVRARWVNSMEKKVPWTAEYRLRDTRTNEYRWFAGTTLPLLNEQSEVVKWVGSASDIHDQKTLNEKLEGLVAERTFELVELNKILQGKNEELFKTQSFLQTVLDASVELVVAFDRNLNFTFVNNRINVVANRKPEELIGKHLFELDPRLAKSEQYEQLQRALNGETIHIKSRPSYLNPTVYFETFMIPLRRNNEVTGVVTMQRDITEIIRLTEDLKRSNEQLKRSNEDLQQFAHVTSHDLKEPVRKIKMYGTILRDDFSGSLPPKGNEYLQKIEKASSRIFAMIDGVLKYSSVESSEQILEDIDLDAVIKSIIDDLEVAISEAGANVHIGQLPVVKGSPTLIYQLFYNLVNNSLKFRKQDVPPIITINSEAVSRDGGASCYKITLKDNGIGFEQAYADKIFESFARLNPKDKFEGTGLGLALCKKIVERHGGMIEADGRLNEGATFFIYLPQNS